MGRVSIRCARSIRRSVGVVSFLWFYTLAVHHNAAAAAIAIVSRSCCRNFPVEFTSHSFSSFRLRTQPRRVFFFLNQFHRMVHSAHSAAHALRWSFLIACKIWVYCWCGVAVDIMCARWVFTLSWKLPQKQTQCRAAQFTVSPTVRKCWRVVGSVGRQSHVGDGHFRRSRCCVRAFDNSARPNHN